MADLFDLELRAMRRDRAFRKGAELFVHERVFSDCLERIALVQRRFRSTLLIGCPDQDWPARLVQVAKSVDVIEPGPRFAQAAGVQPVVEDRWTPDAARYDLCLAVGTLDTVNQLPTVLGAIRASLDADALFLGAIAGGDTLPRLRSAMRAADQVGGEAVPHVHPRIEPAALVTLLGAAGFVMPVVDVDRIAASYETLDRLVADLRAMGATNILSARSRRPISRAALAAARRAFAGEGTHGRTVETFEILHFAAWSPARPQDG